MPVLMKQIKKKIYIYINITPNLQDLQEEIAGGRGWGGDSKEDEDGWGRGGRVVSGQSSSSSSMIIVIIH